MTAWADHGPDGSGEPLAFVLRPGNAGSNTATDHIGATRLALAQLPRQLRRKALIRADTAGGTHEFLTWLTAPGRRLAYSAGFTITEDTQDAIKIPADAWTPAYDGDGEVRDGAWVAEITGMLALDGWPAGMRVIVRKERPHPGAQLRFTDIDGHRFTCFATSTKGGQLPGSTPQAQGAVRGPDPLRQGHRSPEPAPQGLHAESNLVRDRRPGLRTARVDADDRPHRAEPPLGTQTAPPADLRRRRAHRPRRAPPAAAPGRTLAMDRPDHRGDRPTAGTPGRLTSQNRPSDQEGKTARARGTPPTRRDSRALRHSPALENSHQPMPRAT